MALSAQPPASTAAAPAPVASLHLLSGLPSAAAVPARKALPWLSGTFGRRGHRTFRVRLVVQSVFAVLCLVMGWQFARFIDAARSGAAALPYRPPGVEGFLPISGLMGALDWIYRGTLNTIHPAATVLVLTFLAMALLLRKSFCSWICPVGTISDALARLGRRLFKRNFRPTIWVDFPLRSLKYVLLGFFLWAILRMHALELKLFLESPYNRVADIKMYKFFETPGQVTLIVLGVLAVASVFIQGAWCRYLCPYGALLGMFSWLSPVKIRRNVQSCTDCGACDRACTSRLPVSSKLSITSVECTGCLDCVASCPVKGTLTVGTPGRPLTALRFAAAVLLLFALGYGAARLGGVWQNGITADEYRTRVQNIESGAYSHPGM